MRLQRHDLLGPKDVDRAVAAMARDRVEAVTMNEDGVVIANIKTLRITRCGEELLQWPATIWSQQSV